MKTKIIHFCWFGRNKKSRLIKKCIASWKKFCSDYQIIEWNEDNFDVNCCDYVREAYKAKKWAFVSDYCRFQVLSKYGGIYFDTDVEIIKPIDDLPDSFVGFERENCIASGLIRGALPEDEICKLMLDSYHNDKFLYESGELNLKTVCERETEIFQSFGLKLDGTMQTIKGTTVFPKGYFCGKNVETKKIEITENTYTIHHYAGSWLTRWQKFKLFIRKIIGNKIYLFLHKLKNGK